MRTRKMYIDIDGVLVVWDAQHQCIELARGFGRLMRFCQIQAIQPYWLSMWSGNKPALDGLLCLLWPTICPTMAHPQTVVVGDAGKAACIDYQSDFVWIEDGLSARDRDILEQNHALDRFFCTDGLDPDCFLKFMEFTRQQMNLPDLTLGSDSPWDSPMTRPRS